MVTLRSALFSFTVVCFTALSSCSKKADAPQENAPKPVASIPVVSPAVRPVETAAKECAAPIELAPPMEVNVGERVAVINGYKLTFSGKDEDGTLVLGVLGAINEDTGLNMVALKKYLQFFSDEKADGIVVTGDVGESAESISRVLRTLAESKLPVFVLAGNRECRAAFTNGVAMAQKDFSNIFNLNAIRAVEFAELTLVSLPGYHDAKYISCANGTGCQYFKSTVDDVVRVAREAKTPVALVSHGPPHGTGIQALDYASGGGNVGDTEINRAILEGKIAFGFASNIKEAGGRATSDADGTTQLKPDVFSKSLFLNPGPADTFGWEMNDGTNSVGMAAVARFRNAEASYSILRLKAPTTADKAEARRLEPAVRTEESAVLPAAGTGSTPKGTGAPVKL